VVDGPDPGFGGTHLTADVEGLTIAGHQLIASSQEATNVTFVDRAQLRTAR
jgi:3-phytase